VRIKTLSVSAVTLCLVGLTAGQTPDPSPTPGPSPTPRECTVPFSKETDTRVRILAKPEPKFSKRDRQQYRFATITLRATFCGSGQVTDLSVTGSVSATADASAIDAAKLIQFTPAEKDGKKVSREMVLKYQVKD
jgi:Gram-negative bacterial TonB protein C-terminal